MDGGGCLGTREYFVLLGLVSASSSWRKDWSSFSVISSRVKVGGDVAGEEARAWEIESGVEEALAPVSAEELDDQSQPIVTAEYCFLVMSEAEAR